VLVAGKTFGGENATSQVRTTPPFERQGLSGPLLAVVGYAPERCPAVETRRETLKANYPANLKNQHLICFKCPVGQQFHTSALHTPYACFLPEPAGFCTTASGRHFSSLDSDLLAVYLLCLVTNRSGNWPMMYCELMHCLQFFRPGIDMDNNFRQVGDLVE
jgi:hypothetical protein